MIRIFIKLAISAVLIWLVSRNFDVAALWSSISEARIELLAASAFLLAVLILIQAWRWTFVIRAIESEMALGAAFRHVLIGNFFNQTLPSSIGGDAVRVWRVYKDGHTLSAAFNSVVLDRLTALAALCIMAALAQPAIFDLIGDNPARWAVPAILVLGLFGYVCLMSFDRLPETVFRWPVTRGIAALARDARKVFLRLRALAPVLIISVFIHMSVAYSVYLIALALGLEVTLLHCLILVPIVILVSMLPISIAGWGVREGAMVTAFGFVGVPAEQAFVLSVMFGFTVMIVGIPGGVLWFLSDRRKVEAVHLSDVADSQSGTKSP